MIPVSADEYRQIINDKVREIVPILSGLSMNAIEDIAEQIIKAVCWYPITTTSQIPLKRADNEIHTN